MKMYKVNVLLFLSMVLAGCNGHEEESALLEAAPRVINVETTVVKSFSGQTELSYSGLVEARETTPLSFKTPGNVTQILVDEGEFVKKGKLLATLDDTNSRSNYEIALQSKQQAQDAYDRMKPMKENGTLPEIQWVEVETGLNQAIIVADMAERGIDDNKLYAPKSGVIGNKNILPGVNVMPSATAFDLLDINSVYVNIPVPEREVGQLKRGQSAEVKIAATSQSLVGKIDRIGVEANVISHTYPVKILLGNEGWNIKPGMVCNVVLKTDKEYDGVMLSSKALQRDVNGDQYVYLVEDDVVKTKPVRVTTLAKNDAVIQGLEEGDVVVLSGHEKLRNGAKVNVVKKK
ncbi:efflux RND transporter periplasmic adaptor subunit [Neolewinella aurantiaca]|uniref:Efflux RND transporter periplasmic adaptor subunit n=1 Tax=Neolewinella aurantiaca TaxID=2602767 RepID=A0A5C7F513_9BACT|nr:efflux RND transporter periplasmic adaptor subunit [Neolewinella aurantiaca]TXF85682.1 efflux RND transporter periplasmic adaptor subunit [Neolewinella aurantiaca]